MKTRVAMLTLCAPVCSSLVLGIACAGSSEPAIGPPASISTESATVAEYRVTVDPTANSMVFTEVERVAPSQKNFQPIAKGNIEFSTASTVYGVGTLPSTTSPVADAGLCSAGEFCANIKSLNRSGQRAGNLWVEITGISGAATVVENGDRDRGYTEAGYVQASGSSDGGIQTSTSYVSFANGAYWYGDLANGSGATRNWRFSAPTGATFTFTVRVLSTFARAGYLASDGGASTDSASTPFVAYDACDAATGVTNSASYLLNTAGGEVDLDLPFPATVYGVTSRRVYILSNGIMGLGTAGATWKTTTQNSFPLGSPNDPRSAWLANWDNYLYTATGARVCVAEVAGASPRAVVVTWKNVRPNSVMNTGSSLTFSLVVREFTDVAEYIYFKPIAEKPGDSNALRGNSTTIGTVDALGTTFLRIHDNSMPFLPTLDSGSYPMRILVTQSVDPVPCDAGGCNGG